jgi:hypothetical protein
MGQRERIDPSRTDASDAKLAAQVKDWATRPRNYLGDPPRHEDIALPMEKPAEKPVTKKSLRSRAISKR